MKSNKRMSESSLRSNRLHEKVLTYTPLFFQEPLQPPQQPPQQPQQQPQLQQSQQQLHQDVIISVILKHLAYHSIFTQPWLLIFRFFVSVKSKLCGHFWFLLLL